VYSVEPASGVPLLDPLLEPLLLPLLEPLLEPLLLPLLDPLLEPLLLAVPLSSGAAGELLLELQATAAAPLTQSTLTTTNPFLICTDHLLEEKPRR
jgi:hypothetical protein